MLGARRFQNVELVGGAPLPAGQRAYCTLYEMESADAMVRPEMAEAARKGACPPGLEPHRRATNHVYEEFFCAPAR